MFSLTTFNQGYAKDKARYTGSIYRTPWENGPGSIAGDHCHRKTCGTAWLQPFLGIGTSQFLFYCRHSARSADGTKRIRIGSGGIMLPNHSAFKMAENFRTLEALFPGRIDMGIGRAPGGDRITAAILNPSNTFSEESYIRQLEHLQHFFSDTAGTQHGPVIAAPQVSSAPEQWILSSSGGSSLIAARFGAGLAVANFINGAVQPEVVEIYKNNFQPSRQFPRPKALIAIGVLCAATEEKARDMRKFIDFVHLQFEKGNFQHFGDYDTIRKYQFSPAETERIQQNSGRIISGTPDYVKEKLTALAGLFDVEEIIVTTMADSADDRKHSFELLAEAFELQPF